MHLYTFHCSFAFYQLFSASFLGSFYQFIRHRNEDCKQNKFLKLTRFCLVVSEQHSIHVDQENHAAKVEIEVESLIERRRYVRGYYFRHGKGDPHHNQKFPVQRAQSGRQGVAAAETEIEAE